MELWCPDEKLAEPIKIVKKFILLYIFLLIANSVIARAGEPLLTISSKDTKKTFSVLELLNRKDIEEVVVKNDQAYGGRELKFKALPVRKLFEGFSIPKGSIIQFRTLDSFSSTLTNSRLLSDKKDQAIAYIAIEDPKRKWPPLGPGKPSAGPFRLIWQNPQYSSIGKEEWPFMIVAFEIKSSLLSEYPKIFPAKPIAKTDAIYSGFNLFVKNCFSCHTMNKSGGEKMGPDLNIPMNPTEYLKEASLRKLIRNPQDLRSWPKSKMKGFSAKELSEKDLNQIIAYLKHMAHNKQ
jgi:mono/diheme cytochrome c family protein